jgi:capsular polysaccharide biosynthesis protein
MNEQDIFLELKRKAGIILFVGLFVAALAFVLLLVVEKKFESSASLLIVSKSAQEGDFYSQFKYSEYLVKLLGDAVYSDRFLDAAIDTGKFDRKILPVDKRQAIDQWEKIVVVKQRLDLGMLSLSVKRDNNREAEQILSAATEVLTKQNTLFRGGDEGSVEVKLVAGPLTEKIPSFTEAVVVTLFGFILGILFSITKITLNCIDRGSRATRNWVRPSDNA